MSSLSGVNPNHPTSSSSRSSSTNSTSVSAAKVSDKALAPKAKQYAGLSISDLPDVALKELLKYTATTPEGAKALSEVNRDVYFRSRHGIDSDKQKQITSPLPEHKNDPSLSVSQNLEAAEAQKTSLKAFTDKINDIRDPRYTFRLEIAAGFISKLALFLEEKCGIKPEEFHSIMGREYILQRPANKPENELTTPEMNFAFNLDYACHIARALNLAQINEGNNTQNVEALLAVDLTKHKSEDIKKHFDNQKAAIDKINENANTKKKTLRLSNSLYAVPPHIGQLTHIKALELDYNYLTNLPPEMDLLTNLYNEDRGGCDFNPNSGIYCFTPVSLQLTNNNFSTIPSCVFRMRGLKSLDLSNNLIKVIPPEIGQLQDLYSLLACNNQLKTLPQEIRNLKQLQGISIYDNQITELPAELLLLKNLTYLDLRNNPIDLSNDTLIYLSGVRGDDISILCGKRKTYEE